MTSTPIINIEFKIFIPSFSEKPVDSILVWLTIHNAFHINSEQTFFFFIQFDFLSEFERTIILISNFIY